MQADGKIAGTDSPTTWAQAFVVYQRQGSVRLIAAFLLAALLGRLFLAPWIWLDMLAIVSAVVVWPLLEWFLHRYLLHAKPWKLGPWLIDPDYARKHREHHAKPWLAKLTFLPIYVPLLLAPLLLVIAALSSVPTIAFSVLIGLGLAALNYEWTHWIVHTRIQPKSTYYKRVFHNHRMHHFRHEGYWFSFMLPALDRFLGTGPDHSLVQPSGTARNLESTIQS